MVPFERQSETQVCKPIFDLSVLKNGVRVHFGGVHEKISKIFSDISERTTDYSDALDFVKG